MKNKAQNSQTFANQNKTSSKDARGNIGAVGRENPSRVRPGLGTRQIDKHDQVPMEKRKEYDAKYSSARSDARKSAGFPEGTADHK